AFMEAHHAPPEARDAIRFRHGLATWTFDEALEAADRLIPLAAERVNWVSPDELRAGAAVAHLLRHDPASARAVLDRLAKVSTMAPGDLRLRLLYAYAN